MRDLWGYDDGNEFVFDKEHMPNMFAYLSSATKDTITFQQKKIMDSLLFDARGNKMSQEYRDYKRYRRMSNALYGIMVATFVSSSIFTYVNYGQFSPEGVLAVMLYGASTIKDKKNEYKKFAERIAPYGITPKEFLKLVKNKELMEVYRTATYCQMFENDPFKSTLLTPHDYSIPKQEYVFIKPDGTTTHKIFDPNEADEFYNEIRDMLSDNKTESAKTNNFDAHSYSDEKRK